MLPWLSLEKIRTSTVADPLPVPDDEQGCTEDAEEGDEDPQDSEVSSEDQRVE